MNNIKEFDRDPMSKRDFWLATFPVLAGILLLTAIVILWKRQWAIKLRSDPKTAIKEMWNPVKGMWKRFRERGGTEGDPEQGSQTGNSQEQVQNGSPDPLGPEPLSPGGKSVATVGELWSTPPQTSAGQNPTLGLVPRKSGPPGG